MMHRAAETVIVEPLPLSDTQNQQKPLQGKLFLSAAYESEIRVLVVISCHSTALDVAAADALQLNLNAESKET